MAIGLGIITLALVVIAYKQLALEHKVDHMARTEQELSDDLDSIKTGVDAALAAQATLQAEIAALQAGQPVSQDQLDSLTAKADAIKASLSPAPTT